jgi:hypothetical protein
MTCLVEVHTEAEMARCLLVEGIENHILGINNRWVGGVAWGGVGWGGVGGGGGGSAIGWGRLSGSGVRGSKP